MLWGEGFNPFWSHGERPLGLGRKEGGGAGGGLRWQRSFCRCKFMVLTPFSPHFTWITRNHCDNWAVARGCAFDYAFCVCQGLFGTFGLRSLVTVLTFWRESGQLLSKCHKEEGFRQNGRSLTALLHVSVRISETTVACHHESWPWLHLDVLTCWLL